ncbi:Uncharacterised protein [Nocardia brasiliensis]|nr:Uncharacterised protein [Nocardia brasiliensis]
MRWVLYQPSMEENSAFSASFPCVPGVPVDQFGLRRGEEVLHERVVVAVANRSHRLRDSVVCQPIGETNCRVGRAAVGMMDQLPSRTSRTHTAYSRAPSTSSVSQRSEHFQPTIRLENASRTAASQNTPSPVGIRVASATHNRSGVSAVKSRWTRSGAGVAPVSSAAWTGYATSCAGTRPAARLPHQPFDSFAAPRYHGGAASHAPAEPVGAAGTGVDIDDLSQQLLIGQPPPRRVLRLLQPSIERRRRDTQHPQYELDRVLRVILHQPHDHLRVWPSSDAKYALASRNTAFTHSSSATRLRSCLFSSAMSVVGLS